MGPIITIFPQAPIYHSLTHFAAYLQLSYQDVCEMSLKEKGGAWARVTRLYFLQVSVGSKVYKYEIEDCAVGMKMQLLSRAIIVYSGSIWSGSILTAVRIWSKGQK